MSLPYVGEIRLFAGNFAPAGWMFCAGQLLPISENETLFQLIGTTYGGDGQSTFALPDMQSRVPIHQGNGFTMAETGGVEDVTLTVQQIPAHNHALLASSNNASSANPNGRVLAQTPSHTPYYSQPSPNQIMSAASVGAAGGSQPHTNMQPYVCVNFII
ncbi:MAG TPA: tail fiber protein, partial [Ilumatobacteraceae bacterium]